MKLGNNPQGEKVLMLSTSDLGGFRGFDVAISHLPTAKHLSNDDLKCRNVCAQLVAELTGYVNEFGTDAQKQGVACLAETLPAVPQTKTKSFECGLSYCVSPMGRVFNWQVMSNGELIGDGIEASFKSAVAMAESEIEELAGK